MDNNVSTFWFFILCGEIFHNLEEVEQNVAS